MAYNQNFYNNYQGNNYTFQNQYPTPVPILPPPPVPLYSLTPQVSDQEFVKKFERHIYDLPKQKLKMNIRELKAKLITLITNFNEITEQHKKLSENIDNYTDNEWKLLMDTVSKKKDVITEIITEFNGSYMELARKILAKRTAKRLRLKRLKTECKTQKMEWIREMKEKSRKIDENLQKIKDDILKAKKEEEAKLEADMVLKDVRRKKNDAKKCLAKLDALLALRQARQNTAKGRGQNVSENEAAVFQKNIENLKTLWSQRLEMYNKEEGSLQAQLTQTVDEPLNQAVRMLESDLLKWRELLFGGEDPQVNFKGNVDGFVAVRRQWDEYINNDGTALPVGWVVNV